MSNEQMSNENASIPWRRITTESIAIILSILLAFAIDAGWEAMKESEQEKVLLVSLLSDFKEIRSRIDENTERHEKFIETGIKLLSMDATKATKIASNDIDEMLGAVFFDFVSLYLPSGSRDAIFASGDIGIISNKQLRAKLAAWPSRVIDAAEDETFIANDIMNNLMPYLRRNVNTRNIAKRTNLISAELIPGTAPERYDALWKDPMFDNLVSTRIMSETFSIRENTSLRENAEDIIQIIEQELN